MPFGIIIVIFFNEHIGIFFVCFTNVFIVTNFRKKLVLAAVRKTNWRELSVYGLATNT